MAKRVISGMNKNEKSEVLILTLLHLDITVNNESILISQALISEFPH